MSAPGGSVALEVRRGGVAVLSWRRAGRRNAIDRRTAAEIGRALASTRHRPARAVVLYGEGGDFSSGAELADVRAIAEGTRAEALAFSLSLQELAQAIEEAPVPVVAAIAGVCLGLGLEIALAAGARVAAADSRLGLPEMRHGLYPAAGGTVRLPEAVGEARARALILSGRLVTALEASELGMVDRLAPHGGVLDEATRWASELAATGPAVTRFLAARRAGRGEAFAAALAAEREGFADLVRSAPVRRRLDLFLAGRRPVLRAHAHSRPPANAPPPAGTGAEHRTEEADHGMQ